MSSLLVF